MLIKFFILFGILLGLIVLGGIFLSKSVKQFNPHTWFITELYWLGISFTAVCIGIQEIERIEKLNAFKEIEKQVIEDYRGKQSLLAAQVYLLKIDPKAPPNELEGVKWFHKMKGLFDEGLHTTRWENFVFFTRSYVLKDPGCYADLQSNALEYGWPQNVKLKGEDIFLKEEIRWVVDSLNSLKEKKDNLALLKPEENTNYIMRYVFIAAFLIGLALKILRLYSDYLSKIKPHG